MKNPEKNKGDNKDSLGLKTNSDSELNKVLALNNDVEYYDRNGLAVLYSYAKKESYIWSNGQRIPGPTKKELDEDANIITQRFFEMKYPESTKNIVFL